MSWKVCSVLVSLMLLAVFNPAGAQEGYYFLDKWGNDCSTNCQYRGPEAVAVGPSGHVYIADTDNYLVKKYNPDGSFVRKWGTWGTGDGQFSRIASIAVDPTGNVYVSDTLLHRIQKFTSEGTFVRAWGSLGAGEGQFDYPFGIAVDSLGYIYVSDSNNNRIQKFTSDGVFVRMWGTWGQGDGEFSFPRGIAIDTSGAANDVYVADSMNHRIQKFNSNGAFLAKFGSYGEGDGQFTYLEGGGCVAVDSAGYVYVADIHNNRIQKFNSSGVFTDKWGSLGGENGQFDHPFGVAVDSSGIVYVADTGIDRIQKFTSNGNYVSQWKNTQDGESHHPRAIARDTSSGHIYVADFRNHRIQKFTPDGTFVRKWGSFGAGNGQFAYPDSVATNAGGHVYVTDRNNHRIQKFSPDGVFVAKWGSLGSGDGQFWAPTGVVVDSLNYVYVHDFSNQRIQKFDEDGNYVTQWPVGVPRAMTIDPENNIWVLTEDYSGTVKATAYTSNGVFLREWSGPVGSQDGQFASFGGKRPGLGFDSSGNIFVADSGNHRIQKFTSSGTFLSKWGSAGTGNGKFLFPGGVFVDPSGNVYVADTENNRIQKFAYGTIPESSTLTVSKTGAGFGTVTSDPAGIDCGSDCSELYQWSTTITLTAQPDLDSVFSGWVGCDSTNGTQCTVDMTGDQAVSAAFILPTQLSIEEGAIGSEITITGSDFGAKKGKVLIGGVPAKIATDGWSDTAISAALTKVLPAGVAHDVTIMVQPYKTVSPIVLPDAFTVKSPELDPLSVDHGVPGTEITVTGKFFSTKKGKVYLEDPATGKKKNCKVTSWYMDKTNGESELRFIVPKLLPAVYPLKVTNKVGAAETTFAVDP